MGTMMSSPELNQAGLEADARQERMDRVAVLYGEITAATREFLRAVAESDRHSDWAEVGFSSCADWLAWRIGVTRNAASEKVRAARALESLPLISEAMERGHLSYSKVRALTRVATPASEAELLAHAKAGSAAALERLVRGWKAMDRAGEQRADELRNRMRSFSAFPDGEGMYVVRGLVSPEVAGALMRAIEAAGDALYAKPSGDANADLPDPEQRRADALGLVAERALAIGFGGDDAPVSGSRAERYQVVLHVEHSTLRAEGEPGMSELWDGTRVTAETSRRLSCDASVVEIVKDDQGSVLDVGRRARTVPPALRRALDARDRGCRFPGCGLRFTDAHHIEHWADGGETSLRNTLLLCRRHHRLVHEGGARAFKDSVGQVVFFSREGKAIAASPPPPRLPEDPMEPLIRVTPDWQTNAPPWKHDQDVPWAIEAAAREALDDAATGHAGAETSPAA
jgi:hypothetical protein